MISANHSKESRLVRCIFIKTCSLTIQNGKWGAYDDDKRSWQEAKLQIIGLFSLVRAIMLYLN